MNILKHGDCLKELPNLEDKSVDLIVIDPTLLGDVNLDGAINVLDIVSTVNYVMGNIDLEEQGAGNADMNQDGIVDVLDIVSLVDEVMNQ